MCVCCDALVAGRQLLGCQTRPSTSLPCLLHPGECVDATRAQERNIDAVQYNILGLELTYVPPRSRADGRPAGSEVVSLGTPPCRGLSVLCAMSLFGLGRCVEPVRTVWVGAVRGAACSNRTLVRSQARAEP